ncbi:GH39 family glycosyl hydrolase [Sphingomonas sp. PAMC 26605]|uniref:GH39 family glycosyl hydrolase n=1 Tax=Sphingomonas sp. PAMC 26605 TaxID=1112214 RepID=UPI0004962969|nr:beta-xylosidase [Sphingomonas sp. PAMC 26605]
MRALLSLLAGASLLVGAAPPPDTVPLPVSVRVAADRPVAPLPPIWRFFGADEPNYATAPDGAKLLLELGQLRPDSVYFRAHNLLTSGDGTADFKWGSTNIYTERDGKPVYDWHIVDRILDTYRARGLHPYLELGFMPQALSSAPADVPYRRPWAADGPKGNGTGGWNYPPRDYAKWGELIYQFTRHSVARYGRAEVDRWYFEVWNEPNLDFYWSGDPQQFYRLHDVAIAAVRRALPSARVGGPDVAGSGDAFMDGFLKHVTTGTNFATGKTGTPTDFVSFHAKGQPSVIDGHVRMGIANQLQTADAGFAKIAALPALAHTPIVIGENDPEGCAACPGPANAYRNGPLYASYTAASYARLWTLARRRDVWLAGALSWSFTFVGQPWFAGYRQLASNGVDLAVLNVFRLFARLGEQQIAATSDGEIALDAIVRDGVRGRPDIGVLATRSDAGKVAMLLWNYHDDDVPGPAAAVHLTLAGKHGASARLWRVDASHANAFGAWQAMGRPARPSVDQVAHLRAASQLVAEPLALTAGVTDVTIPRQGVALIEVEP